MELTTGEFDSKRQLAAPLLRHHILGFPSFRTLPVGEMMTLWVLDGKEEIHGGVQAGSDVAGSAGGRELGIHPALLRR